jgi:putative ABC transport system ATP-binding protein
MRVRIEGLTVEYNVGDYRFRPLDGFDAEAKSGELVVVLGPSGCGKTTLLSVLAGLLRPNGGSVWVDDTDITTLRGDAVADYRCRSVGVVFQAFNLIPSLTAAENVATPARLAKQSWKHALEQAEILLELVGLERRAQQRPGRLSGGEQQRVAIARALVHDPGLLLADEPTAHLDYIQVETVLSLLRQLADGERIVIVATHDDRLLPLADRVVELTPRAAPQHHQPVRVQLPAGHVLFEQGDPSDLVYVVESGVVEAFRPRSDGSDDILAQFKPGQHFGELGPLLRLPRSASVLARTNAVVVGHSIDDFRTHLRPSATPAGRGSCQ